MLYINTAMIRLPLNVQSSFSAYRQEPGKDGKRAPVPVHKHSLKVHPP